MGAADYFVYDERMGIHIPDLEVSWDAFSVAEQEEILKRWEMIRSGIPDRIEEIEQVINEKQVRLNIEENFITSCRLNTEISELASCINDLNLWFRVNQETTGGKTHR